MWFVTIAWVAAADAQELQKVDPALAYAKAEDALVVRGTLVEPALPFGHATAVWNSGADLDVATFLNFEVLEEVDGVPALSVVELDTGEDFDGDGDVDGRDFLAWQRGNSPDGDSDGRDFLIWQRNLGDAEVDAMDLALWQSNYGQTAAAVDAETWLGGLLPKAGTKALLDPPAAIELVGFEVEQDGKVRGAMIWGVRDIAPGKTEIVSHLWTTAAFEPLLDAGDAATLIPLGAFDSIPTFYTKVVATLDADPIVSYEQTTEVVLKTVELE